MSMYKYNYEIKVLNASRVMVTYKGTLVCKFDRTKEDLIEMVNSILDWAMIDGMVNSHDRKNIRPNFKKEVFTMFLI